MLNKSDLLFLISWILLIRFSASVIVQIPQPRSISKEEFHQQICNFWTPELFLAAEELTLEISGLEKYPVIDSRQSTPSNSRIIPGGAPANSSNSTNDTKPIQVIDYTATIGRVFWIVNVSSYSCSGSIVSSKTKSILSTAAHCLYDPVEKVYYTQHNWVFVPGYSNGTAPFGVWPATGFSISDLWIDQGIFDGDAAFVSVSKLNGKHLQDVVGSQGIGFNLPRQSLVHAFGYPINIDNGRTLQRCVNYASSYGLPSYLYNGQGIACNMTGGSSGGPRIQNMSSNGYGALTSVNSFYLENLPNVLFGPYFDSNTEMLYEAIDEAD